MLREIIDDYKYILRESNSGSYWVLNRLFLGDNVKKNKILAQLLCRYIQRKYPEKPCIIFDLSTPNKPADILRTIVTILHNVTKNWLKKSSFDGLHLLHLNIFDLKMLIDEIIDKFEKRANFKPNPIFVIIFSSDLTELDPTLSVLDYLRSIISERRNHSWLIFAPKTILQVQDASGVSPFYNIFQLRDLQTKFISIESPYQLGMPVTGKMFFGRKQIITNILQNILQQSSPVALWGPRRIGKTSILRSLIEPLSNYYFPFYIDLQAFFEAKEVGLFYQFLAITLIEHVAKKTQDEIKKDYLLNRKISFEQLIDIVKQVEQHTKRKPILLFDEIEVIERIEDGFVALRRLADAGLVGMIVGALRVKKLLHDYKSPIFNRFIEQKLGVLEKDAAQELITKPVEGVVIYEKDTVDEIIRLVGTNPNLLQTLCHLVLTRLNHKSRIVATILDVQEAYKEFLKFTWVIGSLSYHFNAPIYFSIFKALIHIQSSKQQAIVSRDEILQYTSKDIINHKKANVDVQLVEALQMLCDEEILQLVGNQYKLQGQIYLDIFSTMIQEKQI